jgi:hypothetical protein
MERRRGHGLFEWVNTPTKHSVEREEDREDRPEYERAATDIVSLFGLGVGPRTVDRQHREDVGDKDWRKRLKEARGSVHGLKT